MAMTGGTAYKVLSKKANYGSASWTIDLYVYVVRVSQSVPNNTTSLKLGMYVSTPGSDYNINWTDFGGSYLGIGAYGSGAEKLVSFTKSVNGGGKIWLVENIDVTVSHSSDGTAADVPIKWKWGVNSPWGQYVTPSGTLHVDMPTIPRTSSVSAANGTIGSALTISISRESSSFKHTLKYAFGGKSGTIATKTGSTAVSWTPPMSLCSQIPSANSGKVKITCETYSGDTLVGTSSCSATLSVPSSVGLTLSSGWASVSAYNKGTNAAELSGYVQNYSKAQVTFNSDKISTEDSYGATVKSYRVVFDGKDIASPYRTPTLKRSGSLSITCYVTDTRDRTQSTKLKFTVIEYASPTISGISCFRCDSEGKASDSGAYIYVKATAACSSLDGANTVSLKARYKASAGGYGSYINLSSGEKKVIGDGYLLATSTYVVEIVATDTLGGTSLYTGYIPSETVFFHGRPGGNGAGVGKYSEFPGAFEIAWDLRVQGDYYGAVMALGANETIPNGSDFNKYTQFGVFGVTSTASAETMTNIPAPYKGRLIVASADGTGKRDGDVLQEYILYDGVRRFTRLLQTNENGEWSFGSWYVLTATQLT